MSNTGNSSKGKNGKLSTKISILAGGILTIVFIILISFTVITTKKSMNDVIFSEFQALSNISGQRVQTFIDAANTSSNNIETYLQRAYQMSNEGKRNLLGQDFRSGETKEIMVKNNVFSSVVYDVSISEMSSDVEKYIIETARSTAERFEVIEGVGVMFEPYAFDLGIKDYAIYISETDGDKEVIPFGAYADYSTKDYYKYAAETKKAYFTDPYDYNGKEIVTYSYPVLYKDKLQCVVMVDIALESFNGIGSKSSRYPSLYTSISNQNNVIIFDSEDVNNIGANLSNIITEAAQMDKVNQKIADGQAFQIAVTKKNQEMEAFFYPITAGSINWWSITALTVTDMNRSVNTSAIWQVIISVIAMLTTVVLIGIVLRKTLKPIDSIVTAANNIASGKLDIHLEVNSKDEIGILANAFGVTVKRLKAIIEDANYLLREMAAGNFNIKTKVEESYVGDFRNLLLSMREINTNLTKTLTQINEASDQVSSGSDQVSSGAQALSQGATQQASSVEELAATINEISHQVNKNAEHAHAASGKAAHVGNEIAQSNQQMQEMIGAMDEINKSSNQIGKIIKTIEDIAFQTNILALNATVEAARAGVAGKGFAVVADEVRNLASKSAQASKNTAVLIENSIAAVKNGSNIADETAHSLMSVVEDAKEVAATVDKISNASNEQAISIAQVTQGIDQISSVVQTNSATAQESAAASEELSGQSQMLKGLVKKFILKKLNGEDKVQKTKEDIISHEPTIKQPQSFIYPDDNFDNNTYNHNSKY